MGTPDQSPGQAETIRAYNARKFRDIVGRAIAPESQRYHDNDVERASIVHAAASVGITHGPRIEFFHFKPEQVGTSIHVKKIVSEKFDLPLKRDTGARIVPTDAIVISDSSERTRITFALYPDGNIVRTYVDSVADGEPSIFSTVISRGLTTDESTALLNYAVSPHLNPEAGIRATQLTRKEQEIVGERMAQITKDASSRLKERRQGLAEQAERIRRGEE